MKNAMDFRRPATTMTTSYRVSLNTVTAAVLLWGRQSCLAAAFQEALSRHARVFALGQRRPNAGGRRGWLLHNLCRIVAGSQVSDLVDGIVSHHAYRNYAKPIMPVQSEEFVGRFRLGQLAK
jgi:hypothetical protein